MCIVLKALCHRWLYGYYLHWDVSFGVSVFPFLLLPSLLLNSQFMIGWFSKLASKVYICIHRRANFKCYKQFMSFSMVRTFQRKWRNRTLYRLVCMPISTVSIHIFQCFIQSEKKNTIVSLLFFCALEAVPHWIVCLAVYYAHLYRMLSSRQERALTSKPKNLLN